MKVTSTRARIKLRRILQATENDVPRAMQDSANLLHKEMVARAPKNTGNLRDNISSKVLRKGLRAEVGFRGKKAKSNAFYARFVEFGTKGRRPKGRSNMTDSTDFFGKEPNIPAMSARPFMAPTWDTKKPEVIFRVSKAINDAVKTAQKL